MRIGLIQTSASSIDVLDPVSRFHERFPAIEVHISAQPSEAMIEGVAAGTLDLAVVGVGPESIPAGLQARLLATDPLVGVVSERSAAGLTGPLSLQELLARGPLINFSHGTGLQRQVDEALRRAGLETSSRFELAQADDMLRYVARGLGVTIVPRSLTGSMAPDRALPGQPYRVFELADRDAVHPVSVIYDPARLSVSAREFLAMLP